MDAEREGRRRGSRFLVGGGAGSGGDDDRDERSVDVELASGRVPGRRVGFADAHSHALAHALAICHSNNDSNWHRYFFKNKDPLKHALMLSRVLPEHRDVPTVRRELVLSGRHGVFVHGVSKRPNIARRVDFLRRVRCHLGLL